MDVLTHEAYTMEDIHAYNIICLLFRFSSKTLIRLCEQIEGKAIAGMVVIGENQAARSLTLAGTGMNIPVLWSKGGVAKMHGIGKEVSKYLVETLPAYTYIFAHTTAVCVCKSGNYKAQSANFFALYFFSLVGLTDVQWRADKGVLVYKERDETFIK